MKKFYMQSNSGNKLGNLQEDTRVLIETNTKDFYTATICEEYLMTDMGIKFELETLSEKWNYCILK